jgi:drug/metabolite transporter (DMT)-like permease
MIYLALSILSSSAIFILFKYFDKYKVQLLPAIVINYFMASASGFVQVENDFSLMNIPGNWWIASIIISFLFISLFYLMAKTAQDMGVSVSSNATKMSMLIPLLILALLYPEEKMGWLQLIGVTLALFGIYFTSLKKEKTKSKNNLFWPFLLFTGSGILDFILAYANQNLLHSASDDKVFTALSFGMAFCWGLILLLFIKIKKGLNISRITLLGGLLLGIVNFGSIYFLLRTYAENIARKTAIIPINNMSIIIVSTVFSIILFKERLSYKNILGLVLSFLSICMIFYFSS